MKTLIINGSGRKNGDTDILLNEAKKYLPDIIELSAFYDKIKSCNDCRDCWENGKCIKDDKMNIIYNDDFDNVIIASPVYMSGVPGPLVNIASRFQVYYASKNFLNKPIKLKEKNGILILTGGGNGSPDYAIILTNWMFKNMNVNINQIDRIYSLNTDELPASQDIKAIENIREATLKLNKKNTF